MDKGELGNLKYLTIGRAYYINTYLYNMNLSMFLRRAIEKNQCSPTLKAVMVMWSWIVNCIIIVIHIYANLYIAYCFNSPSCGSLVLWNGAIPVLCNYGEQCGSFKDQVSYCSTPVLEPLFIMISNIIIPCLFENWVYL